MAKMFYTLEEAASKLGMSEEEVQGLAESGQLQEFRDRERLVFKVDQVDLLAGDDEEIDIGLADDTGLGVAPVSLSSSGTGSAFNLDASGSNEGTGISIFDPEDQEGAAADANDETLVTSGLGGSGFEMDAGASGSGLAQLAFEPDDTSLGSNLLDSVSDDTGGGTAMGSAAGALFETASGEPDYAAAAPAMAGAMGGMPMGEAYDGAASGLFGGAALGTFLLAIVTLGVMVLGISGGSSSILGSISQNVLYGIAGGGLVLIIVFAAVGWIMLRKS